MPAIAASRRIARARRKIRRSRISPSAPARDRSRPVRRHGAIASRSTTSCCAWKRNSARAQNTRDAPRSNNFMHKVVLLRHGESVWNKENRFTGWTDVDLSDKGRDEARTAGKLLKEQGYEFDIAYVSVLTRAFRNKWI